MSQNYPSSGPPAHYPPSPPGAYQPVAPGYYQGDPAYGATPVRTENIPGGRSFMVAWLLSLLLGGFGVDRFYLGKIGTGLLKLLTMGGFGVWNLIDLVILLLGKTRDKEGQLLHGFAEHKLKARIITAAVWVVGVILFSAASAGASSSRANKPVQDAPAATAPAVAPVVEAPSAAPAPEPPAPAPVEPPPAPAAPAPAVAEPVAPAAPAPAAAQSDVSYANCAEVWAAGAGPIHRGDPGFSPEFDSDGDGTGCESRPKKR